MMRKSTFICLTMVLITCSSNYWGDFGRAQSLPKDYVFTAKKDSCTHFDFHWLELDNEKFSDAIRHVEVFMDEKAFSESNLRILFEYLSNQNPDPVGLTVIVHTDWSQFQKPNPNCPGVAISESSEMPKYDHLQATYWRRPGREYFIYSPAINVDQTKFTRVVLSK